MSATSGPLILLGRHGDEATGADLLNDLDHARVEAGKRVARRIERIPGRAHHSPLVELRIRLRRVVGNRETERMVRLLQGSSEEWTETP
jgi:hypothetical protein